MKKIILYIALTILGGFGLGLFFASANAQEVIATVNYLPDSLDGYHQTEGMFGSVYQYVGTNRSGSYKIKLANRWNHVPFYNGRSDYYVAQCDTPIFDGSCTYISESGVGGNMYLIEYLYDYSLTSIYNRDETYSFTAINGKHTFLILSMNRQQPYTQRFATSSLNPFNSQGLSGSSEGLAYRIEFLSGSNPLVPPIPEVPTLPGYNSNIACNGLVWSFINDIRELGMLDSACSRSIARMGIYSDEPGRYMDYTDAYYTPTDSLLWSTFLSGFSSSGYDTTNECLISAQNLRSAYYKYGSGNLQWGIRNINIAGNSYTCQETIDNINTGSVNTGYLDMPIGGVDYPLIGPNLSDFDLTQVYWTGLGNPSVFNSNIFEGLFNCFRISSNIWNLQDTTFIGFFARSQSCVVQAITPNLYNVSSNYDIGKPICSSEYSVPVVNLILHSFVLLLTLSLLFRVVMKIDFSSLVKQKTPPSNY